MTTTKLQLHSAGPSTRFLDDPDDEDEDDDRSSRRVDEDDDEEESGDESESDVDVARSKPLSALAGIRPSGWSPPAPAAAPRKARERKVYDYDTQRQAARTKKVEAKRAEIERLTAEGLDEAAIAARVGYRRGAEVRKAMTVAAKARATIPPQTLASPAPRSAQPKPKETTTMPDTNTREAIDARITHAWKELSKGGHVPSYDEVAERAKVPGATEDARRQRVGKTLRAAGLARGGRWGNGTEAEPKSKSARKARKASPRPAPAAAATAPAASPRHASTLEGLEQDRERAIATMTGAALQVSSLGLAIAALKGVAS